MQFFALSSDRSSQYIEKECIRFGFKNIGLQKGGVYFEGDFRDGINFSLRSFFSTRLLVEVASTRGLKNADELYDFASKVHWEEWLDSSSKTFYITNTVEDVSWCRNANALSLKVKDAICDRQREVYGERSNIDKENADVVFHLFMQKNQTALYVDFSSRSLSKRHYRKAFTEVHLQESTAAALLAFSPFVTLLEKEKVLSVVDPFVGSGTILIEAALMASGAVPGLIDSERFAFKKLPGFNSEEWEAILEQAKKDDKNGKEKLLKLQNGKPLFIGYDTDEHALEVARINAEAAGVSEFIHLENKDATLLEKADIPPFACIVTDPPYGRRSEAVNLKPLYYKFVNNLEGIINGGSLTLITGDEELVDIIPLEDMRTFHLMNGAVRCTVVNKRFFTEEEIQKEKERKEEEKQKRLNTPLKPGALSLFNELVKKKKEYDEYFKDKGVNCYRLYDGGIKPFNAAIDVFANKWIVISEYSSMKYEEDNASKLDELKLIVERLEITDEENIFIKVRKRMPGKEQYVKKDNKGEKFIIHEHGLAFLVNFTDYLDNGIFLDSRILREKVLKMSKDKRFLNLFSYTGTATVHAAKGGALSTVTVDTSTSYLNWAEENMRINSFTGMNHFYYQEDAMEFLKNLDRGTKFDLVFCDPPTFSNSHSRASFDIQRDHEFMIRLIMKHLNKEGVLLFSTNFRDFNMSPTLFTDFDVIDTSVQTIDLDFRDRVHPIHKSYEIRYSKNWKPKYPFKKDGFKKNKTED